MDEDNLYYPLTIPPLMHIHPEEVRRGFLFAMYESKKSNHEKPMGAALWINKCVRVGHNKNKTHPVFSNGREFYSIHAEMDCILRAGLRFDLTKPTMYIYRETNGMPAMAKPCKYCMKHLIESKVKTIYYTIARPPWYERLDL
jgi:deoxycytidylate deaminase